MMSPQAHATIVHNGRSGLRPSLRRGVQVALGQALLIAATVYVFLQGWRRDIRIPFGFSTDSLLYLMQSKSTIDNGWWWINPMLGAPSVLNELAFPSNSNVDQAIVWMISRVVSHPLASVNLAWVAMVVLSGWSATWCLRKLGVSAISAVVAGTLFAVSPYALYRNIDHFAMVIYLVPFVSTAGLLLASGEVSAFRHGKRSLALLLAGCALIGFNYVYYAFFGCFLVGVASIVGFWTYRQRRILAAGAVCIGLIAGCTVLNLAPSLYSWSSQGKPTIIRHKIPAQAEIYGLKIRHLVSPAFQHAFPPFRWWTQKEAAAQFPLETENMTSRLGLVGTVGFLGLLALLLVPSAVDRFDARNALVSASRLTIAAVLLGTVGGFGSLFNLLVSPEIRAYSRIAPFIAFFSLAAIALAMDALVRTRARRLIVGAIVLALGLADQRMAANGMNAGYPGIAAEIPSIKAFVRELESRLPDRAMVFQLPLRTYLNDEGIARMGSYDHLKLYAVSRRIHWSYPALSNEQVTWQQAAANVPPRQLPYQLAGEGFSAIVVDRYGYVDNGEAVISAIRAGIGPDDVIAQTKRYVALDIRALVGASPISLTPLPRKLVPASRALGSCGSQTPTNIDQIGELMAPFAEKPIHLSGSGGFRVVGWAVDRKLEAVALAVDVVIDTTPFPSLYGLDRRDVAEYFKQPAYNSSGFASDIPRDVLEKGTHMLSLRVVSSDGACYYESPRIEVTVN